MPLGIQLRQLTFTQLSQLDTEGFFCLLRLCGSLWGKTKFSAFSHRNLPVLFKRPSRFPIFDTVDFKKKVYLYAKLNLNCSHIKISAVQAVSPKLMLQTIACRDENHQQTQTQTQLTYELLGTKTRTYPMWKTSSEHQPNHQLTDCCFSHEH